MSSPTSLFFYSLLLVGIFSSCQTVPSTEEKSQFISDSISIVKDSVTSSSNFSEDSVPIYNDQLTNEELDAQLLSVESAAAYRPKDDRFPSFDRTKIEQVLAQKVANGEALVAHIFVPLCDNEHQGIVPTTASLGNGFSLRSNLYWATSTGMKRWFKEKSTWKLLKSIKDPNQDSIILERVIFKRTYKNKATVYLIADAYRGDKMYDTVNDFLRAMSNNYQETLNLEDGTTIPIHGGADLVAFNGHNGLLDLYYNQPDLWYNEQSSQKDMVVIACYANEYFEREAMRAKAYPLVRAISRLHPGAFVISAIIDDWAMLKSEEAIRLSAGRAYCKTHDCSIKTSKKLFYKGWKPENLVKPDF